MKIATVATAVALLLMGCSDAPPKSIQEINKEITGVSETVTGGTKALVVDMKPSSGYDESSYFFMATDGVNKVLAGISKHFPNQQADRVDFVLAAGLTDKYGNTKDSPVIRLSFDMADVRKINYQGGSFTSWDLLRLANDVSYLHPAGKSIVQGYCRDESNGKYARDFCRTYL